MKDEIKMLLRLSAIAGSSPQYSSVASEGPGPACQRSFRWAFSHPSISAPSFLWSSLVPSHVPASELQCCARSLSFSQTRQPLRKTSIASCFLLESQFVIVHLGDEASCFRADPRPQKRKELGNRQMWSQQMTLCCCRHSQKTQKVSSGILFIVPSFQGKMNYFVDEGSSCWKYWLPLSSWEAQWKMHCLKILFIWPSIIYRDGGLHWCS